MGKNMKKSKQNVVGKVKDFKKTKVKVGRKLKNIAETLPKVKVAKICVRSQFNDDHANFRRDRLFDDQYEVPKVINQPSPSLSKLQQLSQEMHAILKQTQTGKKADTRKDSLSSLHHYLSIHHPSITSTNLLDLLESLCVLVVDADPSVRAEVPRLLRVVLSRVRESKGLDEKTGLDWTSDNFPMIMAYIFRAMSNNHFNTTSLLNLEVIFDLCPLVVITTSYRISQSLLKMILNQNAPILSKKMNKKKQILSIEDDEWSGLTQQGNATQSARINMSQMVCKFIKVLLCADGSNRIAYKEHKDNLLDQPLKCLFFAADLIKIMVDIFVDVFYQSRNKGKDQKKEHDDGGGGVARGSIVMMDDGSLEVMRSCLSTVHHCLLLTHHTTPTLLRSNTRCESIDESIALLTSSFPYSAVMRKSKNNKKNKNNKNNKNTNNVKNKTNDSFNRLHEIDVGTSLNEKIASIVLSYFHYHHLSSPNPHSPSLSHPSSQPLVRFKSLTHKLVKALTHKSLIHLPYQLQFYSQIIACYINDGGNKSNNKSNNNNSNNRNMNYNKATLKGVKTESTKDLAESIISCGLDGMKALVGRMRGLIEGDTGHEKVKKRKAKNQLVLEDQEQQIDTQTTPQRVKEQQKVEEQQLQQIATKQFDESQPMQQGHEDQQDLQQQLNEQQPNNKQQQQNQQPTQLNRQQTKQQHFNVDPLMKDFMFWLKLFSSLPHIPSFLLKSVKSRAIECFLVVVDVMMEEGCVKNGDDGDHLNFLINSIRTSIKEYHIINCYKNNTSNTAASNIKDNNNNHHNSNLNGKHDEESRKDESIQNLLDNFHRCLDFKFLSKLSYKNQRSLVSLLADCWKTNYNDNNNNDNNDNINNKININNSNLINLSKCCLDLALSSNAYYDFIETLADSVNSSSNEWKAMVLNYILASLRAYEFDEKVENLESFSKRKSRMIKFSCLKVARIVREEGMEVDHYKDIQ